MNFLEVLGFVIVGYTLGVLCGAVAAFSVVFRAIRQPARAKVSDLYPEKTND